MKISKFKNYVKRDYLDKIKQGIAEGLTYHDIGYFYEDGNGHCDIYAFMADVIKSTSKNKSLAYLIKTGWLPRIFYDVSVISFMRRYNHVEASVEWAVKYKLLRRVRYDEGDDFYIALVKLYPEECI